MEELHKKYRPKTFDEFIGNKAAVASIKKHLEKEQNKIPQAWLFIGPYGCGKTSLQRIIKNELGCKDMNFYEINSSMFTGIDTVRQIEQQTSIGTLQGGVRIFMFDECHQMSKAAQESMLKMLEDAPAGIFYFLGTTNPEKVNTGIKSRCTIISVELQSSKLLKELVKNVIHKETEEEFPTDVIQEIIKASCGRPRDALKLLDSVIEMEDFDEMIECIKSGTVNADESEVAELCRILLNCNRHTWNETKTTLTQLKGDAESIRRNMLNYFNTVLLNNGGDLCSDLIIHFKNNYFDCGMAGLTADCYEIFRK